MRKEQFLSLCILFAFGCNKDVCDLPADQCHTYNNEENCEQTLIASSQVAADVNQYLHPIQDSDPERGFEDLEALGNLVGDTPLVGLGEATHGTLEFFQMKDRIFRHLVTNHGFNAFGFEATWGGALYVNDYIINGVGSAEVAMQKMQFWTWYTEEVKALIGWMHDYNLTKPVGEKIYFYGFDMQSGIEERYWIDKYLEEYLPDIKQEVLTPIDNFLSVANFSEYPNISLSTQQEFKSKLNNSKQLFEDNEDELVQSSSQKEYDLIAYAFEILLQFEDILDSSSGFSRDYYMAVNSRWIRSYIGGNAKVALWAHNGHITKRGTYASQGFYLAESEADRYKAIGFSFSKGKFQAIGSVGTLTTNNTVAEPDCESGNQVLSLTEADNFYLIFNEMDPEGLSFEYFNKYNSYLSIGALFNPNAYDPYRRYIQAEAYDILVHFDSTVSAIPL